MLLVELLWVTTTASAIIPAYNQSPSKVYLPSILFLLSFSGVSGRIDPEASAIVLWLAVISPADKLPLLSVQ